ncbi:MAG TPA: ribonuclease III [Flavipsychrobacter sp.]|nr:ribonuclease III [Flavipsychrobacter sp.]
MKRITSQITQLFTKPSKKELIRNLEDLLGFRPKHIPYYELALMHRSKLDEAESNNERLEFLGDAILGAIIAEYLFKKYPTQDEGFLTELRSRIVRRESLNNVAMRMGLNKLVQYNQQDKGLGRSHIFGNALEALIGAIYLDIGFEKTRNFIQCNFLKLYIDIGNLEATDTNFKNKLLNWSQRNGHTISFVTLEEKNDGSRKLFTIGVLLDEQLVASGNSFNKKDAGQVAAQKAIAVLIPSLE